jgi:hypothetical protein
VLAFSDDEIIRMAREDFIAVAADDWYQRRRQDDVGKFWMAVAQQGRPRNSQGTRQGIYCFTADGKLLAYKNAGQNPAVMRDTLKAGLAAFQRLPAEVRKPGALTVGDVARVDRRYARVPPKGGLVVKVYTRILDRDTSGQYCKGTCKVRGGDQAARDHLWLTETEWKSLVPADPKPGDQFALPDAVGERIARFHLIDNTRGEPPMWQRQEVRSRRMTLTVTDLTAGEVRLRLDGAVLLASQADPDKASRGFEGRLLGYVAYDRAAKAITRFSVVSVGDHWGRGAFTRNARPGRAPLGHVFELVRGNAPEDRIPPQAARQIDAYLGTGR